MKIRLTIKWSKIFPFIEASNFPKRSGIYAILIREKSMHRLLRIGAAHNLKKRPANYIDIPKGYLKSLKVSYYIVPDGFKKQIKKLIGSKKEYRQYIKKRDPEWAEYRIERLMIDRYYQRWKTLPPANFQRGSRRGYLKDIKVKESGNLKVLNLKPAEPSEDLKLSLKQNKSRFITNRFT